MYYMSFLSASILVDFLQCKINQEFKKRNSPPPRHQTSAVFIFKHFVIPQCSSFEFNEERFLKIGNSPYLRLANLYSFFISFIHSTNVCICCKALARLWVRDAEQDMISTLVEQLFLAGEASIQKLPNYFIIFVVIFSSRSIGTLQPNI